MAYDKIVIPQNGARINVREGKLNVPDNPILLYIEGDSIGPDITRASMRIWDAAAGRCQSTVRVDGALLSCAWVDEGRGVVAVGANGLYRFDWTGGAARP